jgi:hypothetical protein
VDYVDGKDCYCFIVVRDEINRGMNILADCLIIPILIDSLDKLLVLA